VAVIESEWEVSHDPRFVTTVATVLVALAGIAAVVESDGAFDAPPLTT
jgi:hypothetical protein